MDDRLHLLTGQRHPVGPSAAAARVHHVRLPVSDVVKSRDWYADMLGFEPLLVFEEEDRVIGVVLRNEAGLVIGLHYAPERAAALEGVSILALDVGSLDNLASWSAELDRLGVDHTPVTRGHLGWLLGVPDPDGMPVELHTSEQPSADEA